jgi:dCMP deaminase
LTRSRPSWGEYFITLVDAAAQRASCDRGLSGAIFVRDNDVLATGYVGAPPGLPDCDVAGHLWQEVNLWNDDAQRYDKSQHCVRTIHAEQNAIIRAARTGTSLMGSTLYCTMEPCANCAMSIIGLGVTHVVAKNAYHTAQRSRDMLMTVGISLEIGSDTLLYT